METTTQQALTETAERFNRADQWESFRFGGMDAMRDEAAHPSWTPEGVWEWLTAEMTEAEAEAWLGLEG